MVVDESLSDLNGLVPATKMRRYDSKVKVC